MLWWASVHIVMINPAAWAFLKVAYIYNRLAMNHDRPCVLATDVRTICYGTVCIPVISEFTVKSGRIRADVTCKTCGRRLGCTYLSSRIIDRVQPLTASLEAADIRLQILGPKEAHIDTAGEALTQNR